MRAKSIALVTGVLVVGVMAMADDPPDEFAQPEFAAPAPRTAAADLPVQGEAREQPVEAWDAAVGPRAPILDASLRTTSFQALLTDGSGDPFPDAAYTLDFHFWRGDGIELLGTVPDVVVNTTNGVATAQVGPLDAGWFDPGTLLGSGLYMSVTVDDVDDDPAGDELLPRIRLGAVPFAFRVDRVESPELADVIALGTNNDHGLLQVWDGISGEVTVELDGPNNMIRTFGDGGVEHVRLWSPAWGALSLSSPAGVTSVELNAATTESQGGELLLRDTGGFLRYHGQATTTGGAVNLYDATGVTLSLSGIDGAVSAESSLNVVAGIGGTVLGSLRAQASGGQLYTYDENGTVTSLGGSSVVAGGFLQLYQQDGGLGVILDGDATGADGGGMLQLYQADGQLGVTADGDSGGAGLVLVRNAGGTSTITATGDEGDGGALLTLSDGSQVTLDFDANAGGGGAGVILRNSNGRDTVVIDADSGDHAMLNLRYDTGAGIIGTIILDASETGTDGGQINVRQSDGTDTVIIDGHEATGGGGAIYLYNDLAVNTVEIDGDETDNASAIRLRKADGTTTITLDPDVSGDGRITTQVLQITGGSDLSEQFDVRAGVVAPEPGMVVCIDPEHPGDLRISAGAYDRTVAGVVSGAGGVNPGMLMGQAGSAADGAVPVALSGRVYCRVDATNAPIRPGDLLTTSDRPGHAMRVTEPARAHGAVLGKAMTPLEEGTGLVLVLVSLQ